MQKDTECKDKSLKPLMNRFCCEATLGSKVFSYDPKLQDLGEWMNERKLLTL